MLNKPNGGVEIPPRYIPSNLTFGGLFGPESPIYPKWLYKNAKDPRKVVDTDDEDAARKEGWDNVTASMMSNKVMANWFWDLEDMSPKQLCVFAKDEYGVDLPHDADQEKLFKAVCELAKHAPQNKDRLVLMAHTVRLNYNETIEEIKRLFSEDCQNVEHETITEEFMA